MIHNTITDCTNKYPKSYFKKKLFFETAVVLTLIFFPMSRECYWSSLDEKGYTVNVT